MINNTILYTTINDDNIHIYNDKKRTKNEMVNKPDEKGAGRNLLNNFNSKCIQFKMTLYFW